MGLEWSIQDSIYFMYEYCVDCWQSDRYFKKTSTKEAPANKNTVNLYVFPLLQISPSDNVRRER